MKILHITNLNERFNGRLHYNTGRRLNNGLIRLGHNVLTVSDRDIINKTKTIADVKGIKSLQKTVIDCYENFRPNLVILGHADGIKLETLDYFKSKNSDLKISQWFLDPLGKHGPDFQKNTEISGLSTAKQYFQSFESALTPLDGSTGLKTFNNGSSLSIEISNLGTAKAFSHDIEVTAVAASHTLAFDNFASAIVLNRYFEINF